MHKIIIKWSWFTFTSGNRHEEYAPDCFLVYLLCCATDGKKNLAKFIDIQDAHSFAQRKSLDLGVSYDGLEKLKKEIELKLKERKK